MYQPKKRFIKLNVKNGMVNDWSKIHGDRTWQVLTYKEIPSYKLISIFQLGSYKKYQFLLEQ